MPEELKSTTENGEMIEQAAASGSDTGLKGGVFEARIPDQQSSERAGERARESFSEILSKMPATALSPLSGDDSNAASVATDAKAIHEETDEEAKVAKLLSLVETKGAEHAVRVALHLNDYYALDRMHDALAERFYDALVAKGVIGRE